MNPESLIKIIRIKDKKKRTQINPQLKNLLTVEQILLLSALRNILRTFYIMSSVMHKFWLVLTYDLLEDRRIDDIIIKTFFNSLLYKTNRFQVAMRLFSNRSQRTSKCDKNISDALGCALCATFLFLPHFDVICGLLLNRRKATWNLFVKYIYIFILLALLNEKFSVARQI